MDSLTTFDQLDLHPSIQNAITELGFTELTPIQAQILPATLAGQDAIGQAQTGTGKTATFLITIIAALLGKPFAADELRYAGEPRALILAPTRELAKQIYADALALTQHMQLHSVCVVGGVDYEQQLAQLDKAFSDMLIATPGRLIDLVHKGHVYLDRVEVLVLDEADRMLDMGFITDIKRLIERMPPKTDRQSLLFSATFNQDVMALAYQWLLDPVFVDIKPEHKSSDMVEQRFYLLTEADKYQALSQILAAADSQKVIVFVNRKDQVRRLFERLSTDPRHQHNVVMLSGDVPQNKRERYLAQFKSQQGNILVATDVAGRGIHVDAVSHVINYTLPEQPDDYVHRIGRTGRAGNTGVSISFVSEDDAFNVPALEAHLGSKLPLQQWQLVD